MKKYIFKLSITIVAFVVGIIFSGSWLNSYFSDKQTADNETTKDSIQIEQIETNRQLPIIHKPIACGTDSFGNRASFSTYTASDGTKFNSTLIFGLKSEKKAQKRFKQEIKNALKIIELAPYLDYWQRKIGEKAVAQFEDKFVLVKYQKASSEYNEDYQVSIIETSTLQKAIDVDKEQESSARSVIVNKLN